MPIKSIFFLLIAFFITKPFLAQTTYQKDTIYLNFNEMVKDCPYDGIKVKWVKKRGIQFNLCGKAVLYHPDNIGVDTMKIKNLNIFCTITMKEVEQKVQHFREMTYKKWPRHKGDKLYQAYDKNDLFVTYLIEVINAKQFVIYPVKWRNQNIIK